jgi:hypothetical protein
VVPHYLGVYWYLLIFACFFHILKEKLQEREIMKKTVGSVASELLTKHDQPLSSIDVQKAQEKEYLDNLIWAALHAQKKVECLNIEGHDQCKDRVALEGDFFVSVLLKKEKLLENVLRNYFVPTKTCPTPCYDQTVYRFDENKQELEFLWVVPDRETCLTFKENKNIIAPQEQGLLKFVLEFYDGTLYKMCKKYNGEKMAAGVALEGN